MGKIEIKAELQRRLDPTGRVNGEIDRLAPGGHRYLNHVPNIVCSDGLEMSVQASHTHYCSPRNSAGPWICVEVGFPTEKVDAFMPYIDGDDASPTDTVYGYVPLSVVADVIDAHGGFAEQSATP